MTETRWMRITCERIPPEETPWPDWEAWCNAAPEKPGCQSIAPAASTPARTGFSQDLDDFSVAGCDQKLDDFSVSTYRGPLQRSCALGGGGVYVRAACDQTLNL